jgi:superfamily II DNA/RNA helicase
MRIEDWRVVLMQSGAPWILAALWALWPQARGLDFPTLRHVILYDVPRDVASFVHCAGRTARRGQSGVVTCLVRNARDIGRYKNLHALQDAPKLRFAEAPPSRSVTTVAVTATVPSYDEEEMGLQSSALRPDPK